MNKEDKKVLNWLDAEKQRIEREYDLKFDEDGDVIKSDNYFKFLLNENIDKLFEEVHSGELSLGELTRAAEILGDNPKGLPSLLKLLKHPSRVVREGAIYGLQNLICDTIGLIRIVADDDESKAVRECAFDALDDFNWRSAK